MSSIPILRIGQTLLVTIQQELDDQIARSFQVDLLETIERDSARGLIIDISGLDMVDSFFARTLANTGRMAQLMGTQTVLVGMRPEVAATLINMGITIEGMLTALNMSDGLALLDAGLAGAVSR